MESASRHDVHPNERTDPEQAVEPPKRIRRRLVIKPIQPTRPRRIRDHGLQLTRRRGAVRTDSDLPVRRRDDGAGFTRDGGGDGD